MDQVKIGKFIARCRKEAGLTQLQLAEKLGITDRAVSKWERGKAMPDSSIMLELCGILKISVNSLLCGEVVTMDNYNEALEKNLLQMVRQKEQSDKRLLFAEIVIGVAATVMMFALLAVSVFVQMEEWLRFVLIGLGFAVLITGSLYALRIEQVAGYYECQKCKCRHIPTYGAVFLAPHNARTRYMRCPECSRRSWQKKVLSKE